MVKSYSKEISFCSKVFVPGEDENGGNWEEQEVTKTAVFNELSRSERNQRKLTFKLLSVIESGGVDTKSGKMNLDTDALADITDMAIDTLLVVDAKGFTEQDKAEFLNDNLAVLNFGIWFFTQKVAPFFSQFKLT